MKEIQIFRKEIQISRNKIQAGRNKFQIQRNEIQIKSLHFLRRVEPYQGLTPTPTAFFLYCAPRPEEPAKAGLSKDIPACTTDAARLDDPSRRDASHRSSGRGEGWRRGPPGRAACSPGIVSRSFGLHFSSSGLTKQVKGWRRLDRERLDAISPTWRPRA
jgi:hypothetical protein